MAPPRPTLTEALHSPAFEATLPKVVAYAARLVRRAGWGEGGDHLPGAVEAEDVVHDAIESCLVGKRNWPEGIDLETFLCGAVRSHMSHLRRDAARHGEACLDEVAEPPAPSSCRDDVLDARRLVAAAARVCGAHPDTESLFAVFVDGEETRADHAAALGWTPERVKVVRAKMNRLLAAAGLHEGDDDEQPRSQRSPRAASTPPGSARRRAAG